MKKRTRNIIVLATVCLITLALLFAVIKINENRLYNMNNNSYIGNYLSEIKYDSINDFIVENPNTIIYVSNSKENHSIKFEKVFAKVIKKYNLENTIYYININNVNIVDLFYQNAPQIIIYKDGNVSEVIDASTITDYNKLIKELKERSIINE